jgi:hypothetical protein
MTQPWVPGAATGLGSLPGTDPVEAAALVFGELPDLPYLAELPARGPGADAIGRGAALLADLPVELVPSGWRITARAGRDLRRARDFLSFDLDALQVAADGYVGPLKVQAPGPWTLAARVDLSSGHAVVSDRGAVRDLTESLAEGVTAHLSALRDRVPGAAPVLQLDEPALPEVLAGQVRTPSGYGTVGAVEADVATERLRSVLEVAPRAARAVHCARAPVPVALLRDAGAHALCLDPSSLGPAQLDEVGAAVEAGASLWLGVLPATDPESEHGLTLDAARAPIERLCRELGFARDELAARVVPTTIGGLADASAGYVRRACALLREVGHWLTDA